MLKIKPQELLWRWLRSRWFQLELLKNKASIFKVWVLEEDWLKEQRNNGALEAIVKCSAERETLLVKTGASFSRCDFPFSSPISLLLGTSTHSVQVLSNELKSERLCETTYSEPRQTTHTHCYYLTHSIQTELTWRLKELHRFFVLFCFHTQPWE